MQYIRNPRALAAALVLTLSAAFVPIAGSVYGIGASPALAGHRVCHWERHHGHRVQVCHWVR
jgi:hypothetical protein